MSEEQAGMLAVLELGPVATDLRGHNSVDLARASGLPTTTARKAKQDVSFWQGGGDLLARSTGKGGAREGKEARGRWKRTGGGGVQAACSATRRFRLWERDGGVAASPPQATRDRRWQSPGLFEKMSFYKRARALQKLEFSIKTYVHTTHT
jgi:hypothetical protein